MMRFFFKADKNSSLVQLVSSKNIDELGLNKINDFQFKTSSNSQHSIKLYYQSQTDSLPSQNSLIILSPSKEVKFSKQQDVIITSYQDHPINRYIDPLKLKVKKARTINTNLNYETIINSSYGPLAITTKQNGYQVVYLGIDLLPFKGKANPEASILLLNILNFLNQERHMDSKIHNYPRPGVYQKNNQNIAVNYFIEAESNLLGQEKVNNLKLISKQTTNNYSDILAWIAIILILIDSLIFINRRPKNAS